MLRRPSHYECTTPRLLEEMLGKIVDAVNVNTAARETGKGVKRAKPKKTKKKGKK